MIVIRLGLGESVLLFLVRNTPLATIHDVNELWIMNNEEITCYTYIRFVRSLRCVCVLCVYVRCVCLLSVYCGLLMCLFPVLYPFFSFKLHQK